MWKYVRNRALEPSTWAGVALTVQAIGAVAGRPDIAGAGVTFAQGVADWAATGSPLAILAAVAAMVMRERQSPDYTEVQQTQTLRTRKPTKPRGFD